MPSSAPADLATAAAFALVERRSRAAPPAPARRTAAPPRTARAPPGPSCRPLAGVRQRERRHPPGRLAGDAQRLAAGGQDAQVGAGPQQAVGQARRRRPPGARSCPAPAAVAGARSASVSVASSGRPGALAARRAPPPPPGAPAPGRPAAPAPPATPRPGSGLHQPRRRPAAPGASCRCPPRRSASAGECVASRRLTSASSCSRPTKLVSWRGRLWRSAGWPNRVGGARSGRAVRRRPRAAPGNGVTVALGAPSAASADGPWPAAPGRSSRIGSRLRADWTARQGGLVVASTARPTRGRLSGRPYTTFATLHP